MRSRKWKPLATGLGVMLAMLSLTACGGTGSEASRVDLGQGVVIAFAAGPTSEMPGKVAYVTHVPSGSQMVIDGEGQVIQRHDGRDDGPARLEAVLADEGIMGRIIAGANAEDPPPPQHADWVDFIKFEGITYISNRGRGMAEVDEKDLGMERYRIAFMLRDRAGIGYRSQDGDAAFLPAGTPIFELEDYDPRFRLAAIRDGVATLYEADTNPAARIGADLLDIRNKVRSIGVNSPQDGYTELASISDPDTVQGLVEMALEASVDQDRRDRQGDRYFVAFHLEDDTAVARSFWLESGELFRGIMTPAPFRDYILQALAGAGVPSHSGNGAAAVATTPLTATPDPDYVPPATPWRPVPLPTASPAERDSAGDSWLYLAAFQNDFISVVDPISGHALHQVPVNADQAGLAVSPDGARLYVVDGLPAQEGKLRIFDTATWQVVHREPVPERSRLLGGNPIALSPDGRWLVVGFYSYDRGVGRNRVFDTERLEFVGDDWELSDCDQTPLRLHGQANNSRVYVQCPGFVAQLRAENLSPLRLLPSPIPFEGGGPGSMQVGGPDLAVSSDGRRLCGLYPRIEHRAAGSLVPVVGTDLPLLVWETDQGERVHDVMMDQQVSVPLATAGRGGAGYLTVSPDGQHIFLAWEDMLWEMGGDTLQVIQELRLPAPVDGMAQSIDGRQLYLLPATSGNLAVRKLGMFTVDTTTLELVTHVDDWPRLTRPFFFAAPTPGQQ